MMYTISDTVISMHAKRMEVTVTLLNASTEVCPINALDKALIFFSTDIGPYIGS